eukprot:TRINITY_DN31453_c0_g1_i1.p1 TRINITY_DN31453_c0_g1~~TRINITY_DN31453_c0_g1_i1.p1  ORF type:complete len:745 (+),score=127.67 TRINITY_DN31453_c0_g1_i1:204-2237(+)
MSSYPLASRSYSAGATSKDAPQEGSSGEDWKDKPATCAARGCGFHAHGASCHCHPHCHKTNFCCEDFGEVCKDMKETPEEEAEDDEEEEAHSFLGVRSSDPSDATSQDSQGDSNAEWKDKPATCAARGCGFHAHGASCHCHPHCHKTNFCCEDFGEVCKDMKETPFCCEDFDEVCKDMKETPEEEAEDDEDKKEASASEHMNGFLQTRSSVPPDETREDAQEDEDTDEDWKDKPATCAAYGCGFNAEGARCHCHLHCSKKNSCCADFNEVCKAPGKPLHPVYPTRLHALQLKGKNPGEKNGDSPENNSVASAKIPGKTAGDKQRPSEASEDVMNMSQRTASCASYGCNFQEEGAKCHCHPHCRVKHTCCEDFAEVCNASSEVPHSMEADSSRSGVAGNASEEGQSPSLLQYAVPSAIETVSTTTPDHYLSWKDKPAACAHYGCNFREAGATCHCHPHCHNEGFCCGDFVEVCKNSTRRALAGGEPVPTDSAEVDDTNEDKAPEGDASLFESSLDDQSDYSTGHDIPDAGRKPPADVGATEAATYWEKMTANCASYGCDFREKGANCHCHSTCHAKQMCCDDFEEVCNAVVKEAPIVETLEDEYIIVDPNNISGNNVTARAATGEWIWGSGNCAAYGCGFHHRGYNCQCNSGCDRHDNCCDDYKELCEDEEDRKGHKQ